MIAPFISLSVQVREPGRQLQQMYSASPLETLAELFGRIAREHRLDGPQAEWTFFINGQPLSWANTVGEVAKYAGDPAVLTLTLSRVEVKREQAEGAGGDWDKDAPEPPATTYHAGPAKSVPPAPGGGGRGGFAGGGYGGGGGGRTGSAYRGVPAPPAAPAAMPAPSQSESRRERADTTLHRDEMPKAKKRSAPADDEDEFEVRLDDTGTSAAVSRQASVRYYHRMNPQRVYPFLVVLSAEEIAEIVQSGVKQAAGDRFDVHAESPVEVEPVLPGCQVYPPRHTLVIGPDTQTLEFWVVPQVLGRIKGAKVIVRQDGETLSEVKLEASVAKQTAAVVVGAMSFVMPYVTKGLKADNPDNSPVQSAMNWAATNLRPEFIFVGLALVAVGLYFWCRPRKRDQFWDVTPKG